MQTIVIDSQKGGSGKTALCAHLAVQAERDEDGPVHLVDTDPQGTLSQWHELRAAETPRRVEVALEETASGLELLRARGTAYCFFGTAPTWADETAALLRLADPALAPICPSPSDLWAAAATVRPLESAAVPFLFVLNQAKANTSITAQAAASLSHHGPVAETFVGDRVPCAAGMTDGRTAVELAPSGPAALKTAALRKNVKTCLRASKQLRR
jgi:chromosome partitioning protein